MAVKTITITEEAYEKLASSKKEGESFSEVINRTFGKKGNIEAIRKFIGAWSHIPDKVIEDMKKDIDKASINSMRGVVRKVRGFR